MSDITKLQARRLCGDHVRHFIWLRYNDRNPDPNAARDQYYVVKYKWREVVMITHKKNGMASVRVRPYGDIPLDPNSIVYVHQGEPVNLDKGPHDR